MSTRFVRDNKSVAMDFSSSRILFWTWLAAARLHVIPSRLASTQAPTHIIATTYISIDNISVVAARH